MFSMKSIKKRILGVSNSEKGFTLIEIIAVLVILGILAAIAVPRYLDVQEGARTLAAQAGINELNARADMAHANQVLNAVTHGLPISGITAGTVALAVTPLVGGNTDDYVGNMAAVDNDSGTLTITSVLGETIDPVTKTWNLPNF